MLANPCVVGIGEVLMDVFEDGGATVGGAPFNVLFHVHQLIDALSPGESFMVSAVGQDDWGRHIRNSVAAAGISTRYLADAHAPTGTALVFEHNGGAGFEIQSNVAWDSIELDDAALDLARRCDATVFGSLAQRSELSRSSIRKFVAQVKGHRLYDVNLRRNTRSGEAGFNAEILEESLRLATMVKMNDAELEEVSSLLGFSPKSYTASGTASFDSEERTLLLMDLLLAEFRLDAVAITRGAKGALMASGGKHLRTPDSTLDQALVHPVGAGDSFAAGLLYGTMQSWTPEQSLELANILSSWVVQHASATPALPEDVLLQIQALAAKVRINVSSTISPASPVLRAS